MTRNPKRTPHSQKSEGPAAKPKGLIRTFYSRDPLLLTHLWQSLVRPHQDYASQLWWPASSNKLMQRLESSQRSFTRAMKGCSDLDYWTRLKTLKMLSTQRRMERYRIIYAWKSLHNLVPNPGLVLAPRSGRRGRTCRIPPLSGTSAKIQSIKEQSFVIHALRLFNSLPKSVREISSNLDDFKYALDVSCYCQR